MERAAHAVLDAAYAARRAPLRRRALLRARGAVPRELARRARSPRRRRDQLEVGLRLHGRLANRRRDARGQGAHRRAPAQPVGGDARRCWATGSRSTRSTPRRSRAACSTTPEVRAELARSARARRSDRAERDRDRARRRRSTARSRSAASTRSRRPGTCTSARRRARSPRADAAGLEVYVKEALANGRLTARGADRASPRPRARGVDDGRARARRGAGPAVGRRRAQRRGHGRAAARPTSTPRRIAWDDAAAGELAPLAEEPAAYRDRRAALPWS